MGINQTGGKGSRPHLAFFGGDFLEEGGFSSILDILGILDRDTLCRFYTRFLDETNFKLKSKALNYQL